MRYLLKSEIQMKKYIPIIALLLLASLSKAQTINIIKTGPAPTVKAIDVEPEYPGGTKAFYKYISDHVSFPADVDPAKLQGIMTISMAIEKDGRLTDFQIIKGVSDVMDKETIRVIASAPHWKPGMQHGEPIRVRYTYNINYALIGKKK